MTDAAYNVGAQRDRAIAAVSEAEHDEDIDEPGDAEADAPRVIRISRPVLKVEFLRNVDDVVAQRSARCPQGFENRYGLLA